MALAGNKFNAFVANLAGGVFNLVTGTSHVCKVLLTNTAPTSANAVKADLTEISAGNGYTAGGASVGTLTGAQSSGTFKLVGGTDPAWTASGGTIGPFRYMVLYDDTPTSPADPLICWWDFGSSITLNAGETYTFDIDQTNGVLTLA
jgi:hypothetical protein